MRSALTQSGMPLHQPRRRFAAVQRITGILLMIFSTTMLPPILVDLCYGGDTTVAFLEGMGLSLSVGALVWWPVRNHRGDLKMRDGRSEEHTSELPSLMRISYAVLCLQKQKADKKL